MKIALRLSLLKQIAAAMGAECKYELSQAAYIKFVLHSLKHRSSAVSGLLVGSLAGDSSASASATIQIADAVPLSHSFPGLLPSLELALLMVEEHFGAEALGVVGYYHANERADDSELRGPAKNIGDQIFRSFPRAAVLLLDVEKMKELPKLKGLDPVVQLYSRDSLKGWRHSGSDGTSQLTLKEPSANAVLLDYIASEKWQEIVDFDDHLDDISKDWLNPDLFK